MHLLCSGRRTSRCTGRYGFYWFGFATCTHRGANFRQMRVAMNACWSLWKC
jgi:hypothetical protein